MRRRIPPRRPDSARSGQPRAGSDVATLIMIVMCLGLSALAAWLAVPRPATQRLRSRLASAETADAVDAAVRAGQPGQRRRFWTYLAIMIILLASIIAAGYVAEARGVVLA